MKHLKTFESYSVNEEIFGLSKSERSESKKAKLQAELDKYLPVWLRKGAVIKPTEEVLSKFWTDAEADGYNGKPGLASKKFPAELAYRPESSIKWGSAGMGGHTFGSGS